MLASAPRHHIVFMYICLAISLGGLTKLLKFMVLFFHHLTNLILNSRQFLSFCRKGKITNFCFALMRPNLGIPVSRSPKIMMTFQHVHFSFQSRTSTFVAEEFASFSDLLRAASTYFQVTDAYATRNGFSIHCFDDIITSSEQHIFLRLCLRIRASSRRGKGSEDQSCFHQKAHSKQQCTMVVQT